MAGGSSKAVLKRGCTARQGDRVTRTSASNPPSGSLPATPSSPPPEKAAKGHPSHKTPPLEGVSE
eukprot:CAMPEP_0174934330 /NCGR_PEP_ID=MMETSP1355-20121228/49202_1 /TAXON_ID=464990 /ORGANISM="Hemiselmis tepida, Strain CCMP443" /LENGTH=64 /DNA_ID=CAMNT_0016180921 /DNA_START=44 /DNA_END=235 /DNA_ORIENTATION=+